MKKFSTFCLRAMLCAIIFVSTFFNAYASHIAGGDLYYAHISDSTYKITLALYGDCGPGSPATGTATLSTTVPVICIYSWAAYVASIHLAIDSLASGIEITPCPGDTSQCTSPASITPGIKKFVYSATYTLPYASTMWRFIYSGGAAAGSAPGRVASISNISDPGGTIIQLTDSLNDSGLNNSSAMITIASQIFYCVGQHDTYDPGLVDPDSDSLFVGFTSATNGTGVCTSGSSIAFIGTAWPGMPASPAYPLSVISADSFSMNNATGAIFFHPLFQRSVVVYNIREFRSGTFVGASQHEMNFIVLDCDSTFPCIYAAPPITSTGLNEQPVGNSNKANVYPNPTTNELTISISPGAYNSYTITNTIGNVLLQQPLTAPQTKVSVNTLPPGLYYITLKGAQGINVQKFVKM